MDGMLWFDNDPKKDLQQKIEEAACFYEHKYGQEPNFAELPLTASSVEVDGLTITRSKSMRPNYIWVGREEMPVTAD